MNQSIEVIEHDEDGLETGRFYFWGKMTIKPEGNRGSITISAPGHFIVENIGTQAAIDDEALDKPPYYCRQHGMTGHTEGSPMCENIIKSDTEKFNKDLTEGP